MTAEELQHLIGQYGAGIEAELTLLRQLKRLAAAQQEAMRDHDMAVVTRIGDEREQTLAGLVKIEHELKPIRHALAKHQDAARAIEGFTDVVTLHRAAANLVATIISSDRETMQALRDAELARRFAAQTIEAGETTLAAYRRVIAPPLASASLVNKRG